MGVESVHSEFGRYVIAVRTDRLAPVLDRLEFGAVPARVCGHVTDDGRLTIHGAGARSMEHLATRWREAIPRAMRTMEDQR